MQKADEVLTGKGEHDNSAESIVAKAHATNLGEALMQGEVTQEVEELRWRTYAVDKESKKKDYEKMMERKTGSGSSKKVDSPVITQENTPIIAGLQDTFSSMTIKEDWSVKFDYDLLPRFNLSRYLRFVTVDKRNKTVTFKFGLVENETDQSSRMFIKELNKSVEAVKSQPALDRYKLMSSIRGVSFVTYKCVGIDDFWKVTVSGIKADASKCRVKVIDGIEMSITMPFEKYEEVYTMTEYHSDTMEEKYRTNAERESYKTVNFSEDRDSKCEVCGAAVNEYVASSTYYETGKVLCTNCYARHLGLDPKDLEKTSSEVLADGSQEKVEIKTHVQDRN